jgi:hypothetical protein
MTACSCLPASEPVSRPEGAESLRRMLELLANLGFQGHLHAPTTPTAHTGRLTKGRAPEQVIGKVKMWAKQK